MREQYVRILFPNYNPDPLSVKQFFQMQSFAKDVQTYLPYQSTTLLDFMSIAYNYCLKTRQNSLDNMACYRDDFRHKVMLFLTKYYPNGFKKNKKGLSDTCYKELLKYRKPRFKRDFLGEYEPIERIWFILALRACHSFLLSGHLIGDIAESHERVAGAEHAEGFSQRSDDHVPLHQCFGTDTDSGLHHDLPGTDGSDKPG